MQPYLKTITIFFFQRHLCSIPLNKVGHSFVTLLFEQHSMHTANLTNSERGTASVSSLNTLPDTPNGNQQKVLIGNTREQFQGTVLRQANR